MARDQTYTEVFERDARAVFEAAISFGSGACRMAQDGTIEHIPLSMWMADKNDKTEEPQK